MAVMIALAQSLMKHSGGWDAVKVKGKVLRFGVRLVFEVCATRAKLFEVDGCEGGGVSRVAWCVFQARPPSTASLPTSYVRHNTTYLYCRSPPVQILNYNWTGPAKKSRLSIADHTLVAFWKHGSTVLQMPPSWAVQTLLANMSQLPCGHLRRCGGCTALLVQLAHSNL